MARKSTTNHCAHPCPAHQDSIIDNIYFLLLKNIPKSTTNHYSNPRPDPLLSSKFFSGKSSSKNFLIGSDYIFIRLSTKGLFFKGPYNRGYLAALCFFCGSRETRQPWSKNKITFCIPAVMYPGYPLPGNTFSSLYRGCRTALQQVKFRLPRRRDSHAIIRSLFSIHSKFTQIIWVPAAFDFLWMNV